MSRREVISARAAEKKRLIEWLRFLSKPGDGVGDTAFRLRKAAGSREIGKVLRTLLRMYSCHTCTAIDALNRETGTGKVKQYAPVTSGQIGLYRELWRQLHAYAEIVREWDAAEAELWFSRWQMQIPRDCECRKHWEEITDQFPPDFSGRSAFRTWAIDAHNAVNVRLGKPLWLASHAQTLE